VAYQLYQGRAAFSFASVAKGKQGAYYFQITGSYIDKDAPPDKCVIHRKIGVKFSPNLNYYISEFLKDINTEGAYVHNGTMKLRINPIPKDLMPDVYAALRYILENVDDLPYNYSKNGVQKTSQNYKDTQVTGMYFFEEMLKIQKIDFDNFERTYGNRVIILAEKGEHRY
jgi:hypothetical protein